MPCLHARAGAHAKGIVARRNARATSAPPHRSHAPGRGRAALSAGLLRSVLAWPGFALGLGQVEVRSRAGEPLLAEIPIISSDPSELEHLQARLASPDTFRRIGLDPPS